MGNDTINYHTNKLNVYMLPPGVEVVQKGDVYIYLYVYWKHVYGPKQSKVIKLEIKLVMNEDILRALVCVYNLCLFVSWKWKIIEWIPINTVFGAVENVEIGYYVSVTPLIEYRNCLDFILIADYVYK